MALSPLLSALEWPSKEWPGALHRSVRRTPVPPLADEAEHHAADGAAAAAMCNFAVRRLRTVRGRDAATYAEDRTRRFRPCGGSRFYHGRAAISFAAGTLNWRSSRPPSPYPQYRWRAITFHADKLQAFQRTANADGGDTACLGCKAAHRANGCRDSVAQSSFERPRPETGGSARIAANHLRRAKRTRREPLWLWSISSARR